MTLFPVAEYIQVGGKVDILVAFPMSAYVAPDFPFSPVRVDAPAAPTTKAAAYTLLFKLGEGEDETRPGSIGRNGDVFGDRYGGREGHPIEKQFNGLGGQCRLRMSRWDPDVLRLIKNRSGLAPGGKVPLANIGTLVLRDYSFRLVLYSVANAKFRFNYPCCWCDDAIELGTGTKHSMLEFAVSAHRAPEGHWAAPTDSTVNTATDLVTGYVENSDMIGVPSPYVIF